MNLDVVAARVLTLVVAGATTFALLPSVAQMARQGGLMRLNFRGEVIPTALGMSFLLGTLAALAAAAATRAFSPGIMLFLVATAVPFGFLGLMDDVLGKTADVRGFRGHLRSLFTRRPTTGSLKLIFGGLTSLAVGFWISGPSTAGLVNGLLIALSANSLNLLDLRPGRAGKGFAVGILMASLFSGRADALAPVMPLTAAMAAYLPYDLSGRGMMGDTGSNALGAAMGLGFVLALGATGKLIALGVLAGLHLFAEKWSLTKVFERIRVLRFLDRLGRT
jgi:UDP-N-acetylmuramyl pentapeptide phosphotransferase/UDP-N-acetylglucosamine-1-phosphate transferase